MHTFAVDGLSVEYCGLSYVHQVLTQCTNELTIQAATAMYAYYAAAETAFD